MPVACVAELLDPAACTHESSGQNRIGQPHVASTTGPETSFPSRTRRTGSAANRAGVQLASGEGACDRSRAVDRAQSRLTLGPHS